jgi:hypothetical protein
MVIHLAHMVQEVLVGEKLALQAKPMRETIAKYGIRL